MKVFCLIRPEPASIYFVNRIQSLCPLEGVIMELPPSGDLQKRIQKRLRKGDIAGLFEALKNRWFAWKAKSVHQQIHQEIFENQWQELANDIEFTQTTDIHHTSVIQKLQDIKPDLLLVHGASILKESILATSKLALNLHWGLSPYYKGVRCTEYALVNWDPWNIGVTIHELASQIDGGRILAQMRPEILPSDTAHRINMKLTYLGTELILKIIEHMQQGKELVFYPQNPKEGQLIQIKHWTKHHHRLLREIEQKGLIGEMLGKPMRREKVEILEVFSFSKHRAG